MRYRELSKLSSALFCAAVSVLCFLNVYNLNISSYHSKDWFLTAENTSSIPKRLPYSGRQVKLQGKKHTWLTLRATLYMRLFWQISLGKTPIRNSSIPIASTDFCLDTTKTVWHYTRTISTYTLSGLSHTCLNTTGQSNVW